MKILRRGELGKPRTEISDKITSRVILSEMPLRAAHCSLDDLLVDDHAALSGAWWLQDLAPARARQSTQDWMTATCHCRGMQPVGKDMQKANTLFRSEPAGFCCLVCCQEGSSRPGREQSCGWLSEEKLKSALVASWQRILLQTWQKMGSILFWAVAADGGYRTWSRL